MEKEIIYNEDLHFEHGQWLRELAFWEDELNRFKTRLSELVTRWTKKEVLTQLEHFQNEFILYGGVIDDLQESIQIYESSIVRLNGTGKDAMDSILFNKHLEFREKMEKQREIYADLKKDFFNFLTRYM